MAAFLLCSRRETLSRCLPHCDSSRHCGLPRLHSATPANTRRGAAANAQGCKTGQMQMSLTRTPSFQRRASHLLAVASPAQFLRSLTAHAGEGPFQRLGCSFSVDRPAWLDLRRGFRHASLWTLAVEPAHSFPCVPWPLSASMSVPLSLTTGEALSCCWKEEPCRNSLNGSR